MFIEHPFSILDRFLKDRVTLEKTGVMAAGNSALQSAISCILKYIEIENS